MLGKYVCRVGREFVVNPYIKQRIGRRAIEPSLNITTRIPPIKQHMFYNVLPIWCKNHDRYGYKRCNICVVDLHLVRPY